MPIYFLRHGESEANEQNRFAGRVDTPLTALGVRQAQQAGRQVAALGIPFDQVHTSTLERARDTAETVMNSLPARPATVVVDDALIERDFGQFQSENKSLVKKTLGYAEYTEYFHSSTGRPPGGEAWSEMYERVRDYYYSILLPASDSGHNILVVSHKYVVEMFAVVIAGLPPEKYRDLKIPNARPQSEADLERIGNSGQAADLVDRLGEHVEIKLPVLMVAACGVGVLAQLFLRTSLPHGVFSVALAVLLAVNTFFGMLRLDPRILRDWRGSVGAVMPLFALRLVAGLALLWTSGSVPLLLAGVFLLLPPALTTPTLSLLWGGDYFTAARHTIVSTVALPVALAGAVWLATVVSWLPSHAVLPTLDSALGSFAVLLAAAFLVPTLVSQGLRRRDPITAGKLSSNWNWLGSVALVPLAAFAAFTFTPVDLLTRLATPGTALPLLTSVGLAVAGALLFRALPWLLLRLRPMPGGIAVDVYITQATPNVFLWIATLAALSPVSGRVPAGLALAVVGGFFVGMYVDEIGFLARFRQARKVPLVELA
jgi:broad specificity phosphatase PhoE